MCDPTDALAVLYRVLGLLALEGGPERIHPLNL
jgi:hypothetical protein